MHGLIGFSDFVSELIFESNQFAMLGSLIEQGTFFYVTCQHFLQTHRLGTKLHPVSVVVFRFAMLVFDWKRAPQTFTTFQRDPIVIRMEFHDIAVAGNAEIT